MLPACVRACVRTAACLNQLTRLVVTESTDWGNEIKAIITVKREKERKTKRKPTTENCGNACNSLTLWNAFVTECTIVLHISVASGTKIGLRYRSVTPSPLRLSGELYYSHNKWAVLRFLVRLFSQSVIHKDSPMCRCSRQFFIKCHTLEKFMNCESQLRAERQLDEGE